MDTTTFIERRRVPRIIPQLQGDIRDIKLERSPWFDAFLYKPYYIGLYEVGFEWLGKFQLYHSEVYYWDGYRWMHPQGIPTQFGMAGDVFRGLKKNPEEDHDKGESEDMDREKH